MKKFNIDPSQVDKLIFSQTDRREFSDYNYKREALLSVEDHFKLMDEYWKRVVGTSLRQTVIQAYKQVKIF